MHNKKGFTIIELIVVIAIIAILAAIIIVSVSGYIAKANAARADGNLHTIATAVTQYYEANGHWPDDTSQFQEPDFVTQGFYPLSQWTSYDPGCADTNSCNVEYYCHGCTYDYENWYNNNGSCILIDIRDINATVIKRKVISNNGCQPGDDSDF